MDIGSMFIVGILVVITAVLLTLWFCKHLYAKKAGIIMKRMCNCSEDERKEFNKVLSVNSNGFGTDIFHLFDS